MINEDQLTPFQGQVVALMQSIVRDCAEGAAEIRFEGNGIVVTPCDPGAAAIHLHFSSDGGFVDFCFGNQQAPFELDEDNYMERLRALSEAVVFGRCGEGQGLLSRASWVFLSNQQRVRSAIFFYPGMRLWKKQFGPYALQTDPDLRN